MNKVIYICLLVIVYLLFRTLSKTEFFDNKHFFKYEENKNKFKFIINHITKYTITKAGDLGPPFMKLMYFDGRKGSIFIPEFHKENEATIKLFFNPKPNNIMTLLHLPKIQLLLTIDNDVYIYKDAKELPIIKRLMNAKESEGNISKIFREVNNLDFDVAYYNSGVTFCDKATATTLSKYMINRFQHIKSITSYHFQCIIGHKTFKNTA